MKRFALFCILALWAVSAEAATYYVRPGGNDSHSCSSAQTDNNAYAKASIQAGINCVQSPGDTVIVHGGTYGSYGKSFVPPNVSGTNLGSGAITVRAASGETVWSRSGLGFWDSSAQYWIIDGINLDGGYWPNNCAGNPDSIACRNVVATVNPHVRLQNLEAKNASYYGIAIAGDAELINVRSHNHGNSPNALCGGNPNQAGGQCHGFYTHTGNVTFDGVEAYNNDGQGITYTFGDGRPITIKNSKLHNNVFALQFVNSAGNHLVYNNIIYDNKLAVWPTSGTIGFYNNTFYSNNEMQLTSGGHIVQNNIFYNTNIVNAGGSQTFSHNLCNNSGTGCTVVGNPQFANAPGGDFHVQAGSPAIDAGMIVSKVTTDFDKRPRPQGAGFTIGAYEFAASTPRPHSAPTRPRRIKR